MVEFFERENFVGGPPTHFVENTFIADGNMYAWPFLDAYSPQGENFRYCSSIVEFIVPNSYKVR